MTSQLLSFSDQLLQMEINDYDESALISHISTCDRISAMLAGAVIDMTDKKFVFRKKRVSSMRINSNNSSCKQLQMPLYEQIVAVPMAVLDAVQSACDVSSRSATLQAVQRMEQCVDDIMPTNGGASIFLQERKAGWIGK